MKLIEIKHWVLFLSVVLAVKRQLQKFVPSDSQANTIQSNFQISSAF